jgi:hypothetical protein
LHLFVYTVLQFTVLDQTAERKKVLDKWLYYRAQVETDVEKWRGILEDDFECVMPVTPYRSFPPHQVLLLVLAPSALIAPGASFALPHCLLPWRVDTLLVTFCARVQMYSCNLAVIRFSLNTIFLYCNCVTQVSDGRRRLSGIPDMIFDTLSLYVMVQSMILPRNSSNTAKVL